jgi:predicted hydrocarbon binding protein
VARRPDAALVFSEAGRGAARRVAALLPTRTRVLLRTLPHRAARAVGFRLARRLARREFGSTLTQDKDLLHAALTGDLMVVTEPGPACSFIGSALAELLRRVAGFDGAMVHTNCRARGADGCAWSAAHVTHRHGGSP